MSSIFIIAEIGVNHNGNLAIAKDLISKAAFAGVDAVKFQTFSSDFFVTEDAGLADYQRSGEYTSQYEMLKALELSHENFKELQDYALSQNVLFLSTPFDESSAEFLVRDLHVPMLKIASGEATNLLFLDYLAKFKIPVILSTGMCRLEEVRNAVNVFKNHLEDTDITLLHCTSSYPCKIEDVNLKAMQTLRKEFGLKVGYSDHTIGIDVAVAAVACGATVIEKHITQDISMKGPDHRASLPVELLPRFVRAIRNTEKSLGNGKKQPTAEELELSQVARKSLMLKKDICRGEPITLENLCSKRPGSGISPAELDRVIGATAKEDIAANQPLTWEDISHE